MVDECDICGHAAAHHIPGQPLPRVGVCANYTSVSQVIEDYFAEIRRDGYIVDGVDSKELAMRIHDL